MAKSKITVTRALVELKRLDARIAQAIRTGTFSAVQVGQGDKAKVLHSAKQVSTVRGEINASFQSVESLLKNRVAVKSAIVASNAVVMVTLGEASMTVAEAIDLKATLPLRKQLITEVKSQMAKAKQAAEVSNTRMESEINTQIQALLGADKAKHEPATLKMITDTQKGMKEQTLIAEDLVVEKLKTLEADLLNIETELDFVLSESNALTSVEVDLG